MVSVRDNCTADLILSSGEWLLWMWVRNRGIFDWFLIVRFLIV